MGAVLAAMEILRPDIPAGSNVVVILHDDGNKYLDTIYNDEWVEENLCSR